MTWTRVEAGLEESQDTAIATLVWGISGSPVGVSLITTPTDDSDRAAELDFTTTVGGAGAYTVVGGNAGYGPEDGRIAVQTAVVNLDVLPDTGKEVELFSRIGTSTPYKAEGWRIQDDGSLDLYDKDGTTVLASTSGAALAANTTARVTVVWDWLSCDDLYCVVFFGDTVVFEDFVTFSSAPGATVWVVGCRRPASDAARGCKLRVIHRVFAISTTTTDAPDQTGIPKFLCEAQLPAGDGGVTDWNQDSSAAGTFDGTYTEWDEAGANDGNTSYNHTAAIAKQRSTGEARTATRIGAADTVYSSNVYLAHRNAVVSKWDAGGHEFLQELSGTERATAGIGDPGSVYTGNLSGFSATRPAGGAWAPADLDTVEFGASLTIVDGSTWRVSKVGQIWVYSTAAHPTSTAIVCPAAGGTTRSFGVIF